MVDETEELTAYHEAGHVVMALRKGARIVRASIEPPWDEGPRRYGETVAAWPSTHVCPKIIASHEIAISLAGPIAESIYDGHPRDLLKTPEWQEDCSRAIASAQQICMTDHQIVSLLQKSLDLIRIEFNSVDSWSAVASIADLLLAHETVEHEQCIETVEFWLRR